MVSGNVYVPQQPEKFQYDADGNLTNDGRWQYVWDAENRLIAMIVNTNIGPQYKLAFAYDPEGQRISKVVSTNGVGIRTNIFLYDGWNLVATVSPSDALINSFMWGPDLSGQAGGAPNGAGGVGGLLEATYYGASTTNCFPAYDGNGNIMALVNAANGQIVANYEYGPFGEVIRQTGPMAQANPFRFSTKYQDDESDLLYYGYRYYKASTGDWLNRDPIGERGGLNLFQYVKGDPIDFIDRLGSDTDPVTGTSDGCPDGYHCSSGQNASGFCIGTCIPDNPPPPPLHHPPPPPPPQPPPVPPTSSGSQTFSLDTTENGKPCNSRCSCPIDFYTGSAPPWNHYQLQDATFSKNGCTCNYVVISGPLAGTASSRKGGFGKICGCHFVGPPYRPIQGFP